ncbi:MAG: hypothetical protein MR215_06880 [Bacteroidales bacterium]|nr:hypothetical protein [Bacteroidales bacterium]MDY4175432.1 hypothetical protein [Bacteroidales bacterium]
MKKLLLFFALALGIGSASAQEESVTKQLILGSQGDNGSWSYGFKEIVIPANAGLEALANWAKLDIASGVSSVTQIVVDIASMTGEWQVVDDQTKQYFDLKVGENVVTYKEEGKEALLMAKTLGSTITLNSVKIDGVQTSYAQKYNLGFYNLDLNDNDNTWASRFFVGANVAGASVAKLKLELNTAVTSGDFQVTATYTDGTAEKFWDITGTGGEYNIGANINEVRICVNNKKGKSISVKSAYLTYVPSALRPITAPDAEVVSTTYYNLAGAKLSQPQRGLNIVVRTLSNGSTLTDKVVVK